MAGVTPFLSGITPLKNSPYYSRVADTNLIDDESNVNYPILAFKPGYALQASELNEIQENFYVQKTLSDNLLQNWWKTGTNLSLTGTNLESLYGPGWEGAIPLSPTQIEFYDQNPLLFNFIPNTSSSPATARQWYLITDPTTKFKFWVVIDGNLLNSVVYARTSLPPVTYFGIKIQTSYINCSLSESESGYIFNDNSSGNYIQNTCGASRFKIKLSNFTSQTSLTNDFLPIIKIRKNADAESQNLILIQYMNNYLIRKESV